MKWWVEEAGEEGRRGEEGGKRCRRREKKGKEEELYDGER